MFPIIAAAVIFVATYVAITFDLLNKTIAALAGASLMLLAGLLGHERVFEAVDWDVVLLLISMMIIAGITKRSGLFQYVAIKSAKIARGNPLAILVLLSVITALFSTQLDNVTTVLIIAPVSVLIAVELDLSPVPFLIAEAIASNVGGTATLIGDPPNIMIGSAAGLDYMDFLFNLAPFAMLLLLLDTGMLVLMFRSRVHATRERQARIMGFDEHKAIEDGPLMIKSLAVLGLVIAGFLLHGVLEVSAAVIALSGAVALMILAGAKETEEFFREVEWGTIFFFVGLFILVGGLVHVGAIKSLAQGLLGLTAGSPAATEVVVLWGSGVLSAVVDNIPYVATMIPLIQDLSATVTDVTPLWWALSLGACLGGNATLIGASANVIVAGISGKSGYRISFGEFTRYGLIVTVVNLALSTVFVLLTP